jgi:Ribonuclease toxin, BrnT, of type II toxin-antitoxin system
MSCNAARTQSRADETSLSCCPASRMRRSRHNGRPSTASRTPATSAQWSISGCHSTTPAPMPSRRSLPQKVFGTPSNQSPTTCRRVPRIVSHWLKTATQRRDTLETAIGELPRPGRYTWIVEFEWDPEKAASNLNKHGVAFTEAMTIFGDPFEVTIPDPDHSDDEFRFLSMGLGVEPVASRRVHRTGSANAHHQRA